MKSKVTKNARTNLKCRSNGLREEVNQDWISNKDTLPMMEYNTRETEFTLHFRQYNIKRKWQGWHSNIS